MDTDILKIDRKIKDPPQFEGKDLILKASEFIGQFGIIEIVGIFDHGECKLPSHRLNTICKNCMLNTSYIIKINDKEDERKYSHLEMLIMQQYKPVLNILDQYTKKQLTTQSKFF